MANQTDTNAWVGVYKFLRDRITSGQLHPGEKINEREITELVNVSRTPVREAFRNLENEGFVTRIPNRGIFVKKYSPEELDSLYRMLIRLEGLAVEMAVPKLSKADLNNLKKLNNRLKSLAFKRKFLDYWTLNHSEFHMFFPRKAGSQELLDIISQLRKRTFRVQYHKIILLSRASRWASRYVSDHDEIINALNGKNKKNPAKLMEAHIERARKAFLDFYKEFGL